MTGWRALWFHSLDADGYRFHRCWPIRSALGDEARARGMTQVAQAAGLTRQALYKALRPSSRPRFDTIQRVCKALGLKLTATVD